MRNPFLIAVYMDLENLPGDFSLSRLFDHVLLSIEDPGVSPLFAIKLACGRTESIAPFRSQLRDFSFDIRETPHLDSNIFKNRADLILSIEAIETLLNSSVDIDLYVFITSDTDFTVVMDKLRKYGKEVWSVLRRSMDGNQLFNASSDRMVIIEDFIPSAQPQEANIQNDVSKALQFLADSDFTKTDINSIALVLDSLERDTWLDYALFGTKIKNSLKSFTYKGKSLNSQKKLFEKLQQKAVIEIRKTGNINEFRIRD
jgi:hypothetical protein